jgi:hypothetical protein
MRGSSAMMPLRRARGFFAFDSFDREADARLRLNQPDPLSDIDFSPPGSTCNAPAHNRSDHPAQRDFEVMRPNRIAGDAERRRKRWTFPMIKIPLKCSAVQSLVDQWLRWHTADRVLVRWFTGITGYCCFFDFG